jgi:hypothetical protein
MTDIAVLTPKTQSDAILAHLSRGLPITPLEALDRFGCFRLGARIWDLRKQGWKINATLLKLSNGKRVAQYRMAA